MDEDDWNDDFDAAEVEALCTQAEASVIDDISVVHPEVQNLKRVLTELQAQYDLKQGEATILRQNLEQERSKNKKHVERIVTENREKHQKLSSQVQKLNTQLQFKEQELHSALEQNKSYETKLTHLKRQAPTNGNSNSHCSPKKVVVLDSSRLSTISSSQGKGSFPSRSSFESNIRPVIAARRSVPSLNGGTSVTPVLPSSSSVSSGTQTVNQRSLHCRNVSNSESIESDIVLRLSETWGANCLKPRGCGKAHSLLKWCNAHENLDSCLTPFLQCGGGGDVAELLGQVRLHLNEPIRPQQKSPESYCCTLTSVTLLLVFAQRRPAPLLAFVNAQKNSCVDLVPTLVKSLLQLSQSTVVNTTLEFLHSLLLHDPTIKWHSQMVLRKFLDYLDSPDCERLLPKICFALCTLVELPDFSALVMHDTGSCLLAKLVSKGLISSGKSVEMVFKLLLAIVDKTKEIPFARYDCKCECREKIASSVNKLILSVLGSDRESIALRAPGLFVNLVLQLQTDFFTLDRVVRKRLIQLSTEVHGLHELSELDEGTFSTVNGTANGHGEPSEGHEMPMEVDAQSGSGTSAVL